MPSNKADQLLKYLSVIGYANPLNMVLVTHRTADTTKGALTEVYRLLNKYLLKYNLIEPIPDKYDNQKINYERFYHLSRKELDYFKLEQPHVDYKTINSLIVHHDTQVIDFCTALYLAYKDTSLDYF